MARRRIKPGEWVRNGSMSQYTASCLRDSTRRYVVQRRRAVAVPRIDVRAVYEQGAARAVETREQTKERTNKRKNKQKKELTFVYGSTTIAGCSRSCAYAKPPGWASSNVSKRTASPPCAALARAAAARIPACTAAGLWWLRPKSTDAARMSVGGRADGRVDASPAVGVKVSKPVPSIPSSAYPQNDGSTSGVTPV